jgi:RNA polymerase sigma factor (sigma-70 family)
LPDTALTSRLLLVPALRTQPDRRLVTLVREGYEAAFEEILRRYGRPLSRYAASIVGGRSEDVTQEAFSKALLALRRDDAEIELRPWLFRIVRNTALNDLRDRPPSPEVLAEAIAGGRDPAEELERREELADLMRRLQALPEPQRAAIVMRELEGLGHEEIAAALGLSGGAARQAIYRARQALRDAAGMLIPVPLLQTLLAGGGSGVTDVAARAAGVGGTAGAGVALKATAATVLVAGAVGAGVALDNGPRTGNAEAKPPPGRVASTGPRAVSGGQTGESAGGSPSRSYGAGETEGSGDPAGNAGRSGGGHDGASSPGVDHGGHRGDGGSGHGGPGPSPPNGSEHHGSSDGDSRSSTQSGHDGGGDGSHDGLTVEASDSHSGPGNDGEEPQESLSEGGTDGHGDVSEGSDNSEPSTDGSDSTNSSSDPGGDGGLTH